MDYIRVRLPAIKIITINEAEPGQVLARSVFTPDDKVLAEGNTRITSDLLRKFKNFEVRNLVVREKKEHWFPKSEAEQLPSEVEILEEADELPESEEAFIEEVQDTASPRKLKSFSESIARQAEKAGKSEVVLTMHENMRRSYELEEDVNQLMNQLQNVDPPEAREKILEALEESVPGIKDEILEVSVSQKVLDDTIQVLNDRQTIKTEIINCVSDEPDILSPPEREKQEDELEKEKVESDLQDTVEFVNQGKALSVVEELEGITESEDIVQELQFLKKSLKAEQRKEEQLKKELFAETSSSEAHKTILNLLDGELEEDAADLDDLPISNELAHKTYELLEDKNDFRKRLWKATDEVSGGEMSDNYEKSNFMEKINRPPESEDFSSDSDEEPRQTTIGLEVLEEAALLFEDGNILAGIEKLTEEIEKSADFGPQTAGKLKLIANNIEELQSQAQTLATGIDNKIDTPTSKKKILGILQGEKEFDPSTIDEVGVPKRLKAEIEIFVEEQENQQERLRDIILEISGGQQSYAESIPLPATEEVTSGGQSQQSQVQETSSEAVQKSEADSSGDERLKQLLSEKDPYDLADYADLELQTARQALEIFDRPTCSNQQQETILDNVQYLVEHVLFGQVLDESRLNNLISKTEEIMQASNKPLKMLSTPDREEGYLLSHTMNTFYISALMGFSMNLDYMKITDLAAGALCVDLGMVEIPRALWEKDGSLTNRGWEEVRKHPYYSKEIISRAVGEDEKIVDLVHQHHEKSDGSGYPRGLDKGEQHPLAPVLITAYNYTAMVENRPHREPLKPDKAMLTMLKDSSHYDKSAIKVLLQEIGLYPNGTIVLLSDGRIATVQKQNSGNPRSPKIFILTDKNRAKLDNARPLDLSEESQVTIKQILKY